MAPFDGLAAEAAQGDRPAVARPGKLTNESGVLDFTSTGQRTLGWGEQAKPRPLPLQVHDGLALRSLILSARPSKSWPMPEKPTHPARRQ